MQSPITHRLSERLAEHGLDALVCVSPENVAYAAGFVVPSADAHALATCRLRGDRRWARGHDLRGHGRADDPVDAAGAGADALGGVRWQRHGDPGRAAAGSRTRVGARRQRAELSVRQGPCRAHGRSARPQADRRRRAAQLGSDPEDRAGARPAHPPLADLRPGHQVCLRVRARRGHRAGPGRRPDPQRVRAGRPELQAPDRRHRRAQPDATSARPTACCEMATSVEWRSSP